MLVVLCFALVLDFRFARGILSSGGGDVIKSWSDLFIETLRDPVSAASFVMKSPLRREDLFAALALCAAINTIAISVFVLTFLPALMEQMAIHTGQDAQTFELRSLPIVEFVLSALMTYAFAFLIAHVGNMFNGKGEVDGLITLVVWFQIFTSVITAFGLFLLAVADTLGLFYFLAFVFVYFRTVLHFINTGHALESLGTAFVIWLISTVGVFIASAIASGLIAGVI
jgi:magnesium-transporting ATPase (P-type)